MDRRDDLKKTGQNWADITGRSSKLTHKLTHFHISGEEKPMISDGYNQT
jgi:hypothetical protein